MKNLIPFSALILLFFGSCSENVKKKERTDSDIYNKAFDFKVAGKLDSAFVYFNQAKDGFLKTQDSLGVGKCLLNMAIISTSSGDYFGGQETSLKAIEFFNPSKENQQIYIKSNYNNLGLATDYLGSYSKAISFYNQSLLYTTGVEATCIVKNNIANIHRARGDYAKAISIYSLLLKEQISRMEFSRILSNLAFTKWLQTPSYNPIPELQKALKIRLEDNDLWGQNGSYTQLADYYFDKNPDSALLYSTKMYRVAQGINSANDQILALQKMIKLSPAQQVKPYFLRYSKLEDSVQHAHLIAKNQFAVIRYETEKHKAKFLKSQVENAQKQRNIFVQWFALAALVVGIIVTILWFRKRNKLLKQEKDLEIKDTELKYVKKIHDRVANKVYQVMTEVENIPDLSRDDILDKLEVIYGISRDISYETVEVQQRDNFSEKLDKMLKSYTSQTIKVFSNGNIEALWKDVNIFSQSEIFCVLQELMTNMNKHSLATNVTLNFSKENNFIKINYKDNGVGLSEALKFKNGLTNTGNRINAINGTITFDTKIEKGLKIDIAFPIL